MLIPFDQLFSRHKIRTTGVLHLGANLGQEADAYAAQGITTVIWVEAIPTVYTHLAAKVAKYPGSYPLLACVSDQDGDKVSFNVANNGGQSSSLLELGTHKTQHPSVVYTHQIEVTTIRVDTLLRQHNLSLGADWFLNIDLQGAELLALRGMGDLLSHFAHAYIEVNEQELYVGCPLTKDIDAHLESFGLFPKETLMMQQGWGDRYYGRKQ